MSGRTLKQLLLDRQKKQGLYDSPRYWDMKATSYRGLARSNWPSNSYNAELHALQMALLDQVLGEVRGLEIADIGCGTGRASVHLARRGASVRGFDFAENAVEAARESARDEGVAAQFEVASVLSPPEPQHLGRYDVVLSLGCLTLACSSPAVFDRAIQHLHSMLRPGGRLLFVEPIHESRILRRILQMSVREWTRRVEATGLRLVDRGQLLFVPVRYALAFRELPRALVAPLFRAGEALLALSPSLAPLSDYKWLFFERRPAG